MLILYFNLTTPEVKGEEIPFYFTEPDIAPDEFMRPKLHSKDFSPEATIDNQSERATILFEHYPDLEKANKLYQNLSWIFKNTKDGIRFCTFGKMG